MGAAKGMAIMAPMAGETVDRGQKRRRNSSPGPPVQVVDDNAEMAELEREERELQASFQEQAAQLQERRLRLEQTRVAKKLRTASPTRTDITVASSPTFGKGRCIKTRSSSPMAALVASDEVRIVELNLRDERRKDVCNLVHRLINTDEQCFEKFAKDFLWAFVEGSDYRVIAAYRGEKLLGGCAFAMLPKGVYVEFLATRFGSRAGVPMLNWLKDEVRTTGRKFITLNSIKPGYSDNRSLHAYAWYLSRGFAPLGDESVLQLLTGLVSPKSKSPLTVKKAHKNLHMPEATEGTTTLVLLGCPPRPVISTQL